MRANLFDRQAFVERIGTDPAVQREIIGLFLDLQPHRMDELAQSVARDDSRSVRILAHSLAGAFRTIAMPLLGDIAKHLETAAARGDLDLCRTLFLELDELFARVMAELSDDPAQREPCGIRVEILPLAYALAR